MRKRRDGNLEVILKILLKKVNLRAGSLNLSTTDILSWTILYSLGWEGGDLACTLQIIQQHPRLLPIRCQYQSSPRWQQLKLFSNIPKCLKESKITPPSPLPTESPWFHVISCEGNMTVYENTIFKSQLNSEILDKSFNKHISKIFLRKIEMCTLPTSRSYYSNAYRKMMTKEKKKNRNRGTEGFPNADKKVKHNCYIAVSKILL